MIYLASIVVLVGLALIFWAFGRKLLSLLRMELGGAAEKFVFSFALGFGAIAYLVLFLGIFNILYGWLLCALLIGLSLWVIPELKKCLHEAAGFFDGLKRCCSENMGGVLLGMLGIVGLVTLFGALSPSYSNDSMVYHLVDAKYFAENHMVGIIPHNSLNSLWPYLVEMYYSLALLFKLFPLTGLFHFSLAIASTVAVYAFSKRYFSRKAGVLAAVIFFLTPVIFTEAAQTYVDLGSVFYAFLAFYAFNLFLEKGEVKWAVLAGIMCGLGLSVKYFFIVVPGILGVYFIFTAFGKTRFLPRTVLKAILLFSLATALLSCAWYVRQYVVRGTPLFPFFADIFGGGGLDPEALGLISERSVRGSHGMVVSLKGLLTLPWRMPMHPRQFGGEQIGALFLAVVPGIILLRNIDRTLKRVSIFLLAYLFLWFIQYQHMRFFLPAIPFLSIISAYVLCDLLDRKKAIGRIGWLVVCLFLSVSVAYSCYHNWDRVKVVTGLESKQDYLAARERSYEVSEYINDHLPEYSRIMVVNETHTFFIDKSYNRELYWWIYERYDKKYTTPKKVMDKIRADGFSYILYAELASGGDAYGEDTRLTKLMRDEAFRKRYLEPVHRTAPSAGNANGMEYIIYKIRLTGEEA
ncbi:MAG: glycosyltransferase family 39 protein [Candidatus Tantalella remota]|nr:glycosyltransferase family 39 protein [Candidatus Tantalella remota]